jgi:hypothetical protein
MKPPNYATTELNAIIARMFKHQSGGWLKILGGQEKLFHSFEYHPGRGISEPK